MRAADVRVGGTYTARVNGRFTTVRIDRITSNGSYVVTNLATGRETVFRSAAKFRAEVVHPVVGADLVEVDPLHSDDAPEIMGHGTPCQSEDEQRPDPTLPDALIAVGVTPVYSEPASHTELGNGNGTSGLAALIASQAAPTTTGLTSQQVSILAAAASLARGTGLRVLVVKAKAGTGKTYSCQRLEETLPGIGQYTAFNAKLVAGGKKKFRRAACNTTHALAYRAVGYRYKHRIDSRRIRSGEVARRLGIADFTVELPESIAPPEADGQLQTRRIKAEFLAGRVSGAVRRFCQSADRELTTQHFEKFDGIDERGSYRNNDRVKEYLLPFARRMWSDLSDPCGVLPFSHDVYVKVWERSNPIIAADYLMLDEYQDTAPVVVSILKQQPNLLVVLVGDDDQRIYEWRGAINAGDEFPGATCLSLTKSFRFGQAVADVANAILGRRDAVVGLETIPSRVCAVANPRCHIYRTNAGAISRLLGGMAEGKRGFLIGGTEEMVAFCRAALELQTGDWHPPLYPYTEARGTNHPELGCFERWSEVREYVKQEEGADLKLMVKIIDDFGAQAVIDALENMPEEKNADFVTTTAHKSKGLEWDSVKIGSDFKTADKLDESERRLLYVACTRGQEELDITECPAFIGSDVVPSIRVQYTQPMPTAEKLAEYRSQHRSESVPASVPANFAAPLAQTHSVSAPGALAGRANAANGIPAAPRPAGPAPSGEAVRQLVAGTSQRVVTYTKLPQGDWGLWASAPILDGEVVEVRTRNGSTKRETVDRVISINEQQKKWLATIRR